MSVWPAVGVAVAGAMSASHRDWWRRSTCFAVRPIDAVKAFWGQYGNLITWTVTLVLVAFAGWNGWNWWQRQQAAKAAAMCDAATEAAQRKDLAALERSVSDLRQGHRTS